MTERDAYIESYDAQVQPDMDDIPHRFWHCEYCGAENSHLDGDCQYCDGFNDEESEDDMRLPF